MHTANRSSTGSRSTYHSTSATGCAPAAHARAKGARPMDAADDFLSEAYARSAGHCADAASALSFRCAPCFSGSLKRRCSCAAAACSSTAFCGCAAARATRLYTVSAVDMSTKQRTPKLRSSSTWIRSKSSCSSAARCLETRWSSHSRSDEDGLERRVLGLPEERRRFSKFRRATVHGRGAVRLAHGHVASVDERLRRRLRRCLHSRGVRPDGDQQIVQVHRAAAVQASVLPVVRDEEGGGFLVSRHNFEKVVRRRKRGPLQRQQDEINHVHVQRRRRFVQRGVVFLHAQQHLDLFRRVALVLQQQLRQAAPAGGMGG
mmetsp:Transcript_7385/g.26339  ORF Transcript_7385/g.26339 Transcript_7385/m.26339 type:complete len:318 (+) Transcript_7385:189-1142(+)